MQRRIILCVFWFITFFILLSRRFFQLICFVFASICVFSVYDRAVVNTSFCAFIALRVLLQFYFLLQTFFGANIEKAADETRHPAEVFFFCCFDFILC